MLSVLVLLEYVVPPLFLCREGVGQYCWSTNFTVFAVGGSVMNRVKGVGVCASAYKHRGTICKSQTVQLLIYKLNLIVIKYPSRCAYTSDNDFCLDRASHARIWYCIGLKFCKPSVVRKCSRNFIIMKRTRAKKLHETQNSLCQYISCSNSSDDFMGS